MGRRSKGVGKLIRADCNLPSEVVTEIRDEAEHIGQGAAQLRRLLIEEAWASYKKIGREVFLARRAKRLGRHKKTGATIAPV